MKLFLKLVLSLILFAPSLSMAALLCEDLFLSENLLKVRESERVLAQFVDLKKLVAELQLKGVQFELAKLSTSGDPSFNKNLMAQFASRDDVITVAKIYIAQDLLIPEEGLRQARSYFEQVLKIINLQDQGARFSVISLDVDRTVVIKKIVKSEKTMDPTLLWMETFLSSRAVAEFVFEGRAAWWKKYSNDETLVDVNGDIVTIRKHYFDSSVLWRTVPTLFQKQ